MLDKIWWQLLILVICSYFLGNLNIALAISSARKKDITKKDSGNPGAMNMYRNFGFLIGASTLIFDMVKGAIPVVAGWLLFKGYGYGELLWGWGEIAMFLAGFSAVIGHVYPVVQKFKGGKGVSSTLGAYFAAASIIYFWYIPFIAFMAALAYIFFFEWGSVGSLIMTTFVPIFMIFYYAVNYSFSSGLLVIILINASLMVLSYWKHRTNLKKLIQGRENRTVLKTIFLRKHKKTSETSEQNSKSDSELESQQNNSK